MCVCAVCVSCIPSIQCYRASGIWKTHTHTHTHTHTLTVGRSAEEGFKAWHKEREWVWRRGSVNDDVIWEKQREEEDREGDTLLRSHTAVSHLTCYVKLQMTSLFKITVWLTFNTKRAEIGQNECLIFTSLFKFFSFTMNNMYLNKSERRFI